jgi:hypothetical protein
MTGQELYNRLKPTFDEIGMPHWNDGDLKCRLVYGVCGWAIDEVAPPYGDSEKFDASEFHEHFGSYVAEAIIQKYLADRLDATGHEWKCRSYISVAEDTIYQMEIYHHSDPKNEIHNFNSYLNALIWATKQVSKYETSLN